MFARFVCVFAVNISSVCTESIPDVAGHVYVRLDGSTGIERRQQLVERFNTDNRIFAFILSTRVALHVSNAAHPILPLPVFANQDEDDEKMAGISTRRI